MPAAVAVHHGSATAGNRSSWQRFQGGFARGYFLRRYGLMTSREAPRVAVTEAIVIAGDAFISRDLSALRGRAAGWRAARGPTASVAPTLGDRLADRLRRESPPTTWRLRDLRQEDALVELARPRDHHVRPEG